MPRGRIEQIEEVVGGRGRVIVVSPNDSSGPRGVTHVGVEATIRLAAARNAALGLVTEPIVVFIDAVSVSGTAWLDDALEQLHMHESLSCLAVPLEGRPVPAATVFGLVATEARTDRPDVLFAWPEAMVLRTSHVRRIGAFDERLSAVGASVDLGWRLWLAGGIVRLGREAAGLDLDPDAPGMHSSLAIQGFDALSTIFVAYDDSRLAATLPAALITLPTLLGPDASAQAIERFQEALPRLRGRRREIQAGRRRPDHELLRLFEATARAQDALGSQWSNLSEGFALDQFLGGRRRVLVVTTDVLTAKMAGPAIRASQIAESLADEHDVRLATTSSRCQLRSARFIAESADFLRMSELEQWSEVIVLQGYALAHIPALKKSTKIMVVDIYDPLHLEALELTKRDLEPQRSTNVDSSLAVLNEQLARGDFFICASEKQRDLWLGYLSALGRVNPTNYDEDPTFRRLIDVVPFGLPDYAAVHTHPAIKGVVPGIGPNDEVIIWGGGLYNWFDPLTLIHAIDRLRVHRPQVRMYFLGGRHPNPEVLEMRTAVAARDLSDRLSLTDRYVFFNEGWVDYEDRQNYLTEASLGVSTHFHHAETAYAFRTRILDYLWAGLPIVATAGDSFADLITKEELGLIVSAGDADGLEDALSRILGDPSFAAACRANVARVREQFRWTTALGPLINFCRVPRRAPDLAAIPDPAVPVARGSIAHDAKVVRHLYRQGGTSLVLQALAGRVRRQRASGQT
ncbi:MAG: glycosyltransferase [Actinomycetota bacterium]|nr:glycosyltransferase [Actinomycetota bacterium]